jgi:DNA-binding NarL/FixJ family response regulator
LTPFALFMPGKSEYPRTSPQSCFFIPGIDLTPREIDVLQLIADGKANKEIGDHLSIGEASVKSHVANILSKLDARDRAHAVAIGLKRGIIEV